METESSLVTYHFVYPSHSMTPYRTGLLLLLVTCLFLETTGTDFTTLNSAGQSIHDIKGGAATTITKKGNPFLMLMEPALPALKYMLPLMALLALPELLSTALNGLRGVAGFNTGYGVQARGRRSAPVDFVDGAQQMMSLLSRLDEAVQKYGTQEASCQLKAMCELHKGGMSPEAGIIAKDRKSVV